MPNLDPAVHETVKWESGHKAFPKGPMYWRPLADDPDTLECVAIGTSGPEHAPREERICTMPRLFKPSTTEAKPTEEESAAATTTTAEAKEVQEQATDKPAVTTGVETAEAPAVSTNSDATSSTVVDGVQNLSINGGAENNAPVDLSEKKAQDDAQAVQATVA
jgi:hypothetical protein